MNVDEWYAGGIAETNYIGVTYNLSTGNSASLSEITGKEWKYLEADLMNAVYENLIDENGADYAQYLCSEIVLAGFDGFYIENGEIVLTFLSYGIFHDGAVINTGIYI